MIFSETDEDGDDGSDTAAESEIEILFADEDGPQNDEESELEDDGGDSESSDDRFLKFLYFIDSTIISRHLYELGNNYLGADSDSLEQFEVRVQERLYKFHEILLSLILLKKSEIFLLDPLKSMTTCEFFRFI